MRRSNGATDAFLSVLQFALSDLAATTWERALAQWIAWHDQNFVGRGVVGFYLEEVLWDRFEFPNQKAFLLRAIDTALTHYRWDELCYEPTQTARVTRRAPDRWGFLGRTEGLRRPTGANLEVKPGRASARLYPELSRAVQR